MKETEDCIIPFKSYADGVHEFDFEIGDSFFQRIENSLIERGNLKVGVQMTKSQQMLRFHFVIDGTITVPCDVCLEDMDYPIVGCEGDMTVKFGPVTEEISDELFQIAENDNEISVSQWIYEILAVSLPIKFVHFEDENGNPTCNPEMLSKLNQYLVTDEGASAKSSTEEETDPRWDKLKGLL